MVSVLVKGAWKRLRLLSNKPQDSEERKYRCSREREKKTTYTVDSLNNRTPYNIDLQILYSLLWGPSKRYHLILGNPKMGRLTSPSASNTSKAAFDCRERDGRGLEPCKLP